MISTEIGVELQRIREAYEANAPTYLSSVFLYSIFWPMGYG